MRLRPTLLDRYIVAEILPPTALGLGLFTFVLLLQSVTLLTGMLIARGADLPTILRMFANLLPSIFATTIPMAFLLGTLLALGRMASDSEIVALRASGVSPAQLLRPVVALALLAGLATFYLLAVSVPDANQAYRKILVSLIVGKAKVGMKPRVFNDDLLPGMVVYISDIPAETAEWKDLFIHDVREPRRPKLMLARGGRLAIDEAARRVVLELHDGVIHSYEPAHPEQYEQQRFKEGEFPLPYEQLFPSLSLAKGDREMTIGELIAKIGEHERAGKPRDALRYRVELHKKFAIPVACLVFGLLGLGLSLGNRKEARSAAFGLSIAVIFVYYVFLRLGEQAGDTGVMVPWLAVWSANMVLGAIALVLLVLNHREAAFDPLDPLHYTQLLPRIRPGKPARAGAPGGLRRPPRPVLVIRLPRFSVRFPSLLDRYVARAFVEHFTLILTGLFAIFMLVEFMDLFDDVQQNRVKGIVVVHYYLFHSPLIVHLMIPVAMLVATLTTFGVMTRRNEITAIKAGGISVYRAVVAVLVLGFVGSGVMFGMTDYLLPYSNKVASRDFNVIKGRPPQSSSYLEKRWILGSDGRFYNYDFMVESRRSVEALAERRPPEDVSLYGLSIYEVDPKAWDLKDRLYLARAAWNGFSYDVERGWHRSFDPHPSFSLVEQARRRDIEPPGYFKREQPEADTLGFGELSAHIRALDTLGFDVTRLRVQLQKKIAFPVICVVMTLIGIPFSFVVGRRGALYGVGLSILGAFVYWTVVSLFEALGNNALLPPLLSAWAPNLIFGAAGMYLMLTLDT